MQILLDNIPAIAAYLPVDISGDFLKGQAEGISRAYPRLSVHPVVADFTKPFALPAEFAQMPKTGFFPGSTIGNFEPHDAVAFMRHAAQTIGQGGVMVMGVDLVKDPAILNAAYNDAAGITAKFNLNLLRRINREFEGNFDLQAFEHHAVYNRERRRDRNASRQQEAPEGQCGGTDVLVPGGRNRPHREQLQIHARARSRLWREAAAGRPKSPGPIRPSFFPSTCCGRASPSAAHPERMR